MATVEKLRDLIVRLEHGGDLNEADVGVAVRELLVDEGDVAEKATFLRALRQKGETALEVTAFVHALLQRAIDPEVDPGKLPGPMIDVCGTGGDRMDLFNVSTTSMFIVAAAGAAVVKHGNRGVTSKSGGADVLEELGVSIDLPPARLRECLERTGVGFLFAPFYHPAFAAIAPVRRKLAAEGTATIFNMLGPLLNPARPGRQLVGVFSDALLPIYAGAFRALGREHAWAVCGSSPAGYGMDEISTLGPTLVRQVTLSTRSEFTLAPEQFNLPRAVISDLRGGDKVENASILVGILAGTISGPKRDIVILNAAAALVVAGLCTAMDEALPIAMEHLASGRALARLREVQAFSNACR